MSKTTEQAVADTIAGALAVQAAAEVGQTTGPLRALVDRIEQHLAIWMTRQPGGVADNDTRAAATVALKSLDDLAAEVMVIRAHLRGQVTSNDQMMMILAAAERDGGRGE